MEVAVKPSSYVEVAAEKGLNPGVVRMYVSYMIERFGSEFEPILCQENSAAIWAERFKLGVAYLASDDGGRAVIKSLMINPNYYP